MATTHNPIKEILKSITPALHSQKFDYHRHFIKNAKTVYYFMTKVDSTRLFTTYADKWTKLL